MSNASNVWDTKTQAFHGGQEHRFLNNFVEDFSVTTNYLGTPQLALEAAREAVSISSQACLGVKESHITYDTKKKSVCHINKLNQHFPPLD